MSERLRDDGLSGASSARSPVDEPALPPHELNVRLAAIAESVEKGRVEMAYQPVVDMRDGHVLGWEALSRFPDLPYPTAEVFERASTSRRRSGRS